MGRKISITAFVLSLLFFIPLAPIVGIILGIIGIVKYDKDKFALGFAIAAVAIGAFTSMINIVMTLGLALGFIRGMFGAMAGV